MAVVSYLSELFSLDGRVALVTGGSSGIGRAIAVALGRAGARVVVVARKEAELAATVDELAGHGCRAAWVSADLGSRDGVRVAGEAAAEVFGEPPPPTTVHGKAPLMTQAPENHPELLERGHPFRQWKTWRIPGTELTLTGYSRANDKTFFHIPELRCCLDAGLCEGRQVDTVFLTHTHHDHSKDIDFLASNAAGTDIYLPAEAVPYVESYLRASAELNHGAGFDPALAGGHRLHGVRQDDEFVFGRRGHHVRVVKCEHKVPCVGYAFSERRKALRPEFEELRRSLVEEGRGKEFGRIMARRRKEGVEVDVEVDRPLFAFLGDTHVDVFERNPWLFEYPVVITECTFLDDAELDRANRVGHTVWSRLKPVVTAHPETLFVLIHFSLRYSDREILAFFQRERGEVKDNVLLWVHPAGHLPEQHQHSGA